MPKEKVRKSFRFDAELMKIAAQQAANENRSLNNWIETLIAHRFNAER